MFAFILERSTSRAVESMIHLWLDNCEICPSDAANLALRSSAGHGNFKERHEASKILSASYYTSCLRKAEISSETHTFLRDQAAYRGDAVFYTTTCSSLLEPACRTQHVQRRTTKDEATHRQEGLVSKCYSCIADRPVPGPRSSVELLLNVVEVQGHGENRRSNHVKCSRSDGEGALKGKMHMNHQ